LFDVVLEDAKIVRLKSCDQSVVRIGDRDVQESEVHIHVQELAGLEGYSGRVLPHVIFFGIVFLGIIFLGFFTLGLVFGLVFIGGGLRSRGEDGLNGKQTYNQDDAEGKNQDPRYAKS
jgi:hypothetical protein